MAAGYKVVVSKLEEPKEGERYAGSTDVYEQTVEDVNILAVIAAVNGCAFTPTSVRA